MVTAPALPVLRHPQVLFRPLQEAGWRGQCHLNDTTGAARTRTFPESSKWVLIKPKSVYSNALLSGQPSSEAVTFPVWVLTVSVSFSRKLFQGLAFAEHHCGLGSSKFQSQRPGVKS